MDFFIWHLAGAVEFEDSGYRGYGKGYGYDGKYYGDGYGWGGDSYGDGYDSVEEYPR
jgi:hypothetical protein